VYRSTEEYKKILLVLNEEPTMSRIFDCIEELFVLLVVVLGCGGSIVIGAAYLTHIITGSYQ